MGLRILFAFLFTTLSWIAAVLGVYGYLFLVFSFLLDDSHWSVYSTLDWDWSTYDYVYQHGRIIGVWVFWALDAREGEQKRDLHFVLHFLFERGLSITGQGLGGAYPLIPSPLSDVDRSIDYFQKTLQF